MELAKLVLENNIFEFSDKTYKQIRRTAIGNWHNIFFIWEHGEESLKEFINEIDSFHSTIKVTADWSKEKVNFLDVEVTLKNGVLSTDLFVKPTDTHQF